MKKRLQKLWAGLKAEYLEAQYLGEWCRTAPGEKSLLPLWAEIVLGMIASRLSEAICRRFGHRYVNEDWANPDSGGYGLRCKRCGYSFHHILY